MLKRLSLIFMAFVIVLSCMTAPLAINAAEESQTEEIQSVEDQIPEESQEEESGKKGNGFGRNSGGAIFIMVAVVAIGMWLIVDGVVSFIKKSKKESENRFNRMKD